MWSRFLFFLLSFASIFLTLVSVTSFAHTHKTYLDNNGLDHYTDFHANIGEWIKIPSNLRYIGDVECANGDYDNCDYILAARNWILAASPTKTKSLFVEEQALNNMFDTVSFEGFAFTQVYGYADSDDRMMDYTFKNLITATSVVFILMLIFMDLPSAVAILICICMIDIDLMGMMYIWNVNINSVSFAGLVMSVGLSIDYNVHIAHAFLHSNAKSVAKKTADAMDLMGMSVLKGAATTLLGSCVLGFASSTVFRIFFKVCFGTVIFGSLHGILFLPVILGFYMKVIGVDLEETAPQNKDEEKDVEEGVQKS